MFDKQPKEEKKGIDGKNPIIIVID